MYPALGFPLAFLVIGILEKSLGDPFLPSKRFPSTTLFMVLVGPLLILNFQALLPYSEEHAAGWLFRVAPVRDLARVFTGVRRAFLISILLPLFLLMGVLLSWFWTPAHAFWHAAFGFILSYLFLGVAFLFYRGGFPFSQEPAKMTQTQQMTLAFLSMPLFGALFFLIYALYRHPKWLVAAAIVLLIFGWGLNRAADRKAARVTRRRLEGELFAEIEDLS